MATRAKYRRLPDLYVTGAVLPLMEDMNVWLQIMNPFEVEEARRDAQVARSRYVLAMREVGSPEYDELRGIFYSRGRDLTTQDILELHYADHFIKATHSVEVDEEWKEKWEIMNRADEIAEAPIDDPERVLLTQINTEWMIEVNNRTEAEQTAERHRFERMTEEELLSTYEDLWLERRGGQLAVLAYNVAEIFFSARVCDAVKNEDDAWDHSACDHKLRVFETKQEVRELPEPLFQALKDGLASLVMTVREAKNSDRLVSSSASSHQPSQVEESTPSIPTVPQVTVPGR